MRLVLIGSVLCAVLSALTLLAAYELYGRGYNAGDAACMKAFEDEDVSAPMVTT